ncbi:MAG: hypothetical protein AAF664_19035 [Planctomycetota bacterium]
MSARRRSEISPSLFPFLAVLVCTLGTLILLLALVAQKATDTTILSEDSQSPTETKEPDDAPEQLRAGVVESMIATEDFRAAQLVKQRDEQTEEIQARRDAIQFVRTHLDELSQELSRINDEVERVTSDQSLEDVDAEELRRLQERVEDAQTDLEEAKSEFNGKPRLVIHPHKGPNGTDRRPIYLECDAEGLLIHPLGIRITTDQLAASEKGANPLDTAIRVIRNHYISQTGEASPPYPLLIVRPEGIESFAASRGAMAGYDDQYGYELVPSGIELATGKPERVLVDKVRRAVDLTIARQSRFESGSGSTGFGGSGAGRGRLRGSGGVAGGSSRQRFPEISASNWSTQGLRRGYRSAGRDELADGLRSQASELQSGRYAGSNSYKRQGLSDLDDWARSGSPNSNSLNRNDVGPGTGSDLPSTEELLGTAPANVQDNPMEESFEQGGGVGNAVSSDATSQATTMSGSEFDPSSPSQGNSQIEYDSGASASDWRPTNEAVSDIASQDPQRMSNQNRSEQQTPGGSISQNNMAQPPTFSDAPSDPSMSGAPSMMASNMNQQDLVDPNARDFATVGLITRGVGSGIVRPIRVLVYSDRIVLPVGRDSVNGNRVMVFPVNGSPSDLRRMREFATEIRGRISRWGAALSGQSWLPRLNVYRQPGSQQRVDALEQFMQNSGVEWNLVDAQPSGGPTR